MSQAAPFRFFMSKAPQAMADCKTPVRRVRPAEPCDLNLIDRLEQASFDRDRFARRNLRRLLLSPSAAVLVAEDAEGPSGYAVLLYRKGAKRARLYSIAVDPRFRRRGVGESLIAAAARSARARGADRLRLELRPSNASAMRLYERAGFTFLERKAGYYEDGEDAVRMELPLASAV
jgi:ribosomal protein S18 acetylase RimI-like enzyme